ERTVAVTEQRHTAHALLHRHANPCGNVARRLLEQFPARARCIAGEVRLAQSSAQIVAAIVARHKDEALTGKRASDLRHVRRIETASEAMIPDDGERFRWAVGTHDDAF